MRFLEVKYPFWWQLMIKLGQFLDMNFENENGKTC